MKLTRIILSVVFVLFASTALAAKPGKILICHVGNELGSMDETYQDNPDCTIPPEWAGDPADYICPDAGKIDLILVSTKAKHIGNPAHYFEDDTGYPWADYSPEDGIGDDPADFEEGDVVGIDRGCELEEEQLLACPCWDTFTEQQVVDILNAEEASDPDCSIYNPGATRAQDNGDGLPTIIARNVPGLFCQFRVTEQVPPIYIVDQEVADNCVEEVASIIPQISWCQPPP